MTRTDTSFFRGLQVWDVTDPANPEELAKLSTGCCTRGLHELEVQHRPDLGMQDVRLRERPDLRVRGSGFAQRTPRPRRPRRLPADRHHGPDRSQGGLGLGRLGRPRRTARRGPGLRPRPGVRPFRRALGRRTPGVRLVVGLRLHRARRDRPGQAGLRQARGVRRQRRRRRPLEQLRRGAQAAVQRRRGLRQGLRVRHREGLRLPARVGLVGPARHARSAPTRRRTAPAPRT